MSNKDFTREGDETRLHIIKRANEGAALYEISREIGKGINYASVFLRKLIEDDILYSGEDPTYLASFYPNDLFNTVMNKLIKEGKCTGLTS